MDYADLTLAIAVTASFAAAYLIGVMLADVRRRDRIRKLKRDNDAIYFRGERFYLEEDEQSDEKDTTVRP